MRSPKSSMHDCPCFVAVCLNLIRKIIIIIIIIISGKFDGAAMT